MKRRLKLLVTIVVTICLVQGMVEGGFTSGAPCSDRNTAYLSPLRPIFPSEPVKCVDITAMGSVITFQSTWPISHADTLFADHMHLKHVAKTKIFIFMPHLTLIDLSGNEIKRLPVKMHTLAPSLTKLLVAQNQIVIPKKGALMRSPSLDTLMLSNNKIRNLYPNTFNKMPALRVLYLDSNYLEVITPKAFRNLEKLQYLHLGNNLLTTVPTRDQLPRSLSVYILKGNKLEENL